MSKEKDGLEFSKTLPLIDFIGSLGASTMKTIINPKTGLRFFTVPGTRTTGAVALAVPKVLTKELSVSWCEPKDPNKEAFYMVHSTSEDNVDDTFSI